MIEIGTQNTESKIKRYFVNADFAILFASAFRFIVFVCGESVFGPRFGTVQPGLGSVRSRVDDTTGGAPKPSDCSFLQASALRRSDLSNNELGTCNRPISAKLPAGQTRGSVLRERTRRKTRLGTAPGPAGGPAMVFLTSTFSEA
jgi:hypothetical protein